MPKVLNMRQIASMPPQWNGGLEARDRGRSQRENETTSAMRERVMTLKQLLIVRYNKECVSALVHIERPRAVKRTPTGGTETRRGQRS
jgi:hypothetical protein